VRASAKVLASDRRRDLVPVSFCATARRSPWNAARRDLSAGVVAPGERALE
jgi:hypothetical protein